MKLTPQPDGRIAIVFTAEEDRVLDQLDHAARNAPGTLARVVYAQLMQPNNPDLVHFIASMGPPRG